MDFYRQAILTNVSRIAVFAQAIGPLFGTMLHYGVSDPADCRHLKYFYGWNFGLTNGLQFE